ncbi:hypothetical protein Tco_0994660 [Tanacetum coccineum]
MVFSRGRRSELSADVLKIMSDEGPQLKSMDSNYKQMPCICDSQSAIGNLIQPVCCNIREQSTSHNRCHFHNGEVENDEALFENKDTRSQDGKDDEDNDKGSMSRSQSLIPSKSRAWSELFNPRVYLNVMGYGNILDNVHLSEYRSEAASYELKGLALKHSEKLGYRPNASLNSLAQSGLNEREEGYA